MSRPASIVRCWIGVAGAVRGLSPTSLNPVEVAASEWPRFAVAGEVLGVLVDDELRLHNAITGALRSTVPAAGASNVLADGTGFWLDERHVARRLSFEGTEQNVVALDKGLGLIAVTARLVATRVLGPYDYGWIRVLSTSGAAVLETPQLTNTSAAALTADGIVVASDEGVNHWMIGAATTPPAVDIADIDFSVTPRSQARGVCATPNGWCELWLDVESETSRPIGPPEDHSGGSFQRVEITTVAKSRIVRVVAGTTVASRSFDGGVLGIATSPGRTCVLLSGRPAGDIGPAEDLRCFIGDDDLEPVAAFSDLGERWRGGFAVAVEGP